MTLQVNLVNLGSYPNDGTGDDLRSAFIKSNQNFQSIADNVILDAANLGTGAGIFASKLENTLQFKSIKSANNNMAVSFDSNEISLTVQDSINSLVEDLDPILGGTLNLNNFDIEGFGNINISGNIFANTVTANLIGQVSDISNHLLSDLADVIGTIPQPGQALVWNGSAWGPNNVAAPGVTRIIAGNNITINPSNGVGDVTVEALVPTFNDYDFGLLSGARNVFDLLLQFTNIDFGAIGDPSNINLELGPIVFGQALYNLSPSVSTVLEGNQFTISLTTINVPNNTSVPYIISGVDPEDINGVSLTGQFTIIDNFASITFTTNIDELTEDKTFTITLVGISPTISTSVIILDDTVDPVDPGDEYVSGDVDGGSPTTNIFNSIADGGSPFTTVFTVIANGGVVNDTLDGGAPNTVSFTGTIEGGDPSSVPTEVYDGGIVD